MYYELNIDQQTGNFRPIVIDDDGTTMEAEMDFTDRGAAVSYVIHMIRTMNPHGPVRMTRKKVYNERVIGRPGFWELTTYDWKDRELRKVQYREELQEGYLRALVQEQIGFPLEAAERID